MAALSCRLIFDLQLCEHRSIEDKREKMFEEVVFTLVGEADNPDLERDDFIEVSNNKMDLNLETNIEGGPGSAGL